MVKTLDEFQVPAAAGPQATFDDLAALEWIRAREHRCVIGPAGTGKRHWLLALARATVRAGQRVRSAVAADLGETLYRGLADHSVGRVIEGLLRNDWIVVDELGCAPLDDVGTPLRFRCIAAAQERRSLGVASHWPFDQWGRFLPQHSTAAARLDRLLHHAVVVVTEGESFRRKEARARTAGRSPAPLM